MKLNKILCLVFALLMVMSFAACGGETKDSSKKTTSTQTETVPAAVGDNAIGTVIEIDEYKAVVTGAELMKDEEGADVIAITYDYTNNSEEAESFSWAFFYELKQGETVLDYAIVFVSKDSYDFVDDAMSEEVQPGETKSVTMTYKLIDTTTPVDVEFSDLLSEQIVNFTVDVASLK